MRSYFALAVQVLACVPCVVPAVDSQPEVSSGLEGRSIWLDPGWAIAGNGHAMATRNPFSLIRGVTAKDSHAPADVVHARRLARVGSVEIRPLSSSSADPENELPADHLRDSLRVHRLPSKRRGSPAMFQHMFEYDGLIVHLVPRRIEESDIGFARQPDQFTQRGVALQFLAVSRLELTPLAGLVPEP